MSKTLTDFITNKIAEKYHDETEVIKMITEGKTTLLNPAYNEEYRKFLQKFIDGHDTTLPVLLNGKEEDATNILVKRYGYSKEDTMRLVDGKIGVFEDNHTFLMGGIGGVGANILHMLQKFKHKSTDREWNIEAVEFDDIELSNIFRFPFTPLSTKKTDNASKLGIAATSQGGVNVNVPVLYDVMNIPDINMTPMGAFDTQTRLNLNEMKLPSLVITHKDDKVTVEVSPYQSENQDIVYESYGKIDINFLLPALHMTSRLIFLMMNPEHPITKKISEFKLLKHIQITKMLGNGLEEYHYRILKKLKYRAKDNITWETEDEYFEKIQLETTKLFYKYYSNKKYHKMLNDEIIPEGTVLYKLDSHDDSHKFDMEMPIHDKVEEMWEEISDHTVLEITQDDVYEFLDMDKDEDLTEYINKKTNMYK